MVDLSKPLEQPVHLLEPSEQPSGQQARAPLQAVPVSSFSEIQENLMHSQRITGLVEAIPAPARCRLEDGFLLPAGSVCDLRAGEAIVAFQQTRTCVEPRAFLALEPVQIHGPAAYLPIDAIDAAKHHFSLIDRDDGYYRNEQASEAFGWIIVSGLFAGALEAIAYFCSATVLGFTLKAMLIILAGIGIAKKTTSIWEARGKNAKKVIEMNIMNGVELFLPKILHERAGLPEEEA